MSWTKTINIRGKFALMLSFLIATISLFIFLFFPARQKQQALNAVSDKAKSISQMTAYSLSPGLFFDDYDAVKEVVESARQNKDIVYIEVLNDSDKVYFSYQNNLLSNHSQYSSENQISWNDDIYRVTCPIIYSGHQIGRLILDISLASILNEINRSRETVALVSLIIFILGMVAVFIFTTIITSPLSRIVETVGYVSRGDLSKRAVVSSNDEVGNLAKSFNQMVENLQSARNELEDLNKTLELKVEGRTQELVNEIADRKKADELLQHSEEKYRSLIENISDGVLGTDFEDNIFFANSASCTLFGYNLNELQSMNLKQLISLRDMDKFGREAENRLNGVNSQYEMGVIKKDNQPCQVLISATSNLDDNGILKGSIYVCKDVTELNKIEEEKQALREKLTRAQRMESLGVLAGGVAHDLNNILGPLVAYPEVIRMKLPPESPALNYIGKIEESAKRAAEVVQDLLTMARRGRYEMAPMQLNEVIESYLHSVDFANHVSKHPMIEMLVSLDKDLPLINGSTSHFSKVVMNLMINAMEAMSEGGRLSVKTECRHVERLINGFGNIDARKYVILTISDTGVGINQKDLKQIFEPFYSKKEMGKSGSGLGLAIVYGVIKDHNGYIDVKSEIGKGSDFLVYLPALGPQVVRDKHEILDIRGSASILVVDDILEQRELAATTLSSIGYKVSIAASGREAVKYIKEHTVDIVILDMIMEDDFDGLDTYREIIKFRPGQKAIIASGYAETDRVKEAERLGVNMYVRKPYTMQTLGMSIKKVLADRQSIEQVSG